MGELGWAGIFGRGVHLSEEMPRVLWGSLQGEGAVAGAPLTPVCYSTDQVKGVLTLQGDALSQAVSLSTVQLVTRMVMVMVALPPASCVTLALTLVSDLFPCMSVTSQATLTLPHEIGFRSLEGKDKKLVASHLVQPGIWTV